MPNNKMNKINPIIQIINKPFNRIMRIKEVVLQFGIYYKK